MMEIIGNVSRRIRHAPNLMWGASHSQSCLSHARKQCPTLFNDKVYFNGGATTSSLRSMKKPISCYTTLHYTRCDDSFQRSRKERSSLLLLCVILPWTLRQLLQASTSCLLILTLPFVFLVITLLFSNLTPPSQSLLVWLLSQLCFSLNLFWLDYCVNAANPFVLLYF